MLGPKDETDSANKGDDAPDRDKPIDLETPIEPGDPDAQPI